LGRVLLTWFDNDTDPEGDFVEAIGRNFTVEAAAKIINNHVADWRGKIDRS
jgi:protein SCO1/2